MKKIFKSTAEEIRRVITLQGYFEARDKRYHLVKGWGAVSLAKDTVHIGNMENGIVYVSYDLEKAEGGRYAPLSSWYRVDMNNDIVIEYITDEEKIKFEKISENITDEVERWGTAYHAYQVAQYIFG